ncbi:iron complex outermembrane receptor protein [Sphingomonas sp. PP-F2F-G114-C0414]|uniref:TonB-dependent receptor n=1 Tax=Sphingomonas sp. PP-F2F-G114-C0414 TaxID=2135662 RepID=UPI000EF92C2C|nr:TonB-dependent receptor [Sphingomonas sp. PP-F2F-G114-C0414]RMB26717.1 iron complex outermembrane receptor protein [Sphingomonas sp. PP-F2F-G114-C0414]
MKRSILHHSVVLVALALSAEAHAQQAVADQPSKPAPAAGDGDIVVTAQRRSERLQDVPIAVTAITGDDLRERRIADVLDLSGRVPGLQIRSADNGANPRIFIRGVGLNDFNPATASAVGIYVNGVYVASTLAQRDAFFDLGQVEVLRGPQGTLYGRNTTGGAINVTTRQPGTTPEADLSLDYGRFNAVTLQGGISAPVATDLAAVRIAGLYQRDDGYMRNTLTGNRGNNVDRWALRGSVHLTPSSAITDDLTVNASRSTGGSLQAYARTLIPQTAAATGADGLCTPAFYTSGQCTNILGYANTSRNLYEGAYRFEGRDRVSLFGTGNTLSIDLGPVSLIAVTGFQHASRNDQEDTDASPVPVVAASYISRQDTVSQELRVQSNGHDRLRYVAGVYYAHDLIRNASSLDVLPVLRAPTPDNPSGVDLVAGIGDFAWPSRQVTNSYAGFGQLDFDLTPRLTLTGGLRYSADRKRFDYRAEAAGGTIPLFTYADAKTFGSWSGRAGLQYRFSDAANVYASYNRGTKSGGFFSGFAQDPSLIGPYKDETVDAYEVGAKTQWLDRRLGLNVSAFYYDYEDLQVFTSVVQGLITTQLFTNASAARIYGAELELTARPVDGLNLSASTSLLSATYRDFISQGADYSGNRLPSAPKVSVQGSAEYRKPIATGAIVARADVSYRSKVFFDTSNDARLTDRARAFVDGRIGWQFAKDRYEVALWVRNVFDVPVISDITPLPALGFDAVVVGRPRTFGLSLRANYR